MRDRPARLVLLGHPVSHSLSPIFQTAAIKSAGLQATYDALDVTPEMLPVVLHDLARGGVAGNVTIPHKEAFAAACASTTELAARVGAVNTFWHEKGRLVGDNTDVAGAVCAIRAVLDAGTSAPTAENQPRVAAPGASATAACGEELRVAVLGAGGAAAAVLVALEVFAPLSISVFARTPARAHDVAHRVGASVNVADVVEDAVRDATLVINCTPIGLQDDNVPVSASALLPAARVLDLIPKRGDTAWVRECRLQGHVAEDGLRMLIEQGAAAFERWFGIVPDRASMWRSVGARREASSALRIRRSVT